MPERIAKLDAIGMVWDVLDYLFERNYHASVEYHREHGDLDVPLYYVSADGIRLGAWLASMRAAQNSDASKRAALTDTQIILLNELGFSLRNKHDINWEKSYAATCAYKKYGDLNIPIGYITEDGCRLGRWIRRQRDALSTISQSRRDKLLRIGMDRLAAAEVGMR